MKRRSVLQSLIAGSSSLALTPFLHAGCVSRSEPERVLILLDLKGGNDGLNTLAPIQDDRYRRARPTLALNTDAPVLDRGLALHPSLAPLLPLWDQTALVLHLVLVGRSRVGVISRHPINGQRGVRMEMALVGWRRLGLTMASLLHCCLWPRPALLRWKGGRH